MQTIPVAKKIPQERTIHGETIVDNWYYLKDRNHPETIPYLETENRYTNETMLPHLALERQLYEEMVARIQETDVTVPYRYGSYEYYSRTEKGKQYPVLCRRLPEEAASEQVILDCNALAEGQQYFALAFDRVSPDGNILAYAVNTDGSEVYTLRFRDLRTGELLPDVIHDVYYSAAWDAGSAFFYTTLDETKRPWRVWRHELGSTSADTLVLEEPDGRFNLTIDRSRSGAFLFLTASSHTTSEVRYVDTRASAGEFRILKPRVPDVEYFADHQGQWFYIRSNEDAKNFQLLRALVSDPDPARWEVVTPHRRDVAIERVEAFENFLVVFERAEGLRRILIEDTRTGEKHFVLFDEPVYTLAADRNEEYSVTKFRFAWTSLITPRSIFDYDMATRERDLKKRYAVFGGYDSANYVSERIFARSHDGVSVPISLVYRKDLAPRTPHPLYLYGYGSYGIITEPAFSPERVSLLDRGFVFAMAHVRGSGDMGRFWYEDGKLLNKQNTFLDFIACAEHLITNGYTSPERMAAAGGSAGGLLVGAVANMRPDLFRVVVAHVPFVDVVNTMLDETLPLTITEYEEWGNPKEREFYEYMRSYTPYENIWLVPYPDILVTGGLNDPRVGYWEPAKWVAKLRDQKAGENLILLRTVMGAGHGGPSGRYDKLKEKAFEFAFVIARMRS